MNPEKAQRLGNLPLSRGNRKTLVISVALSALMLGVLFASTFSNTDPTNAPPQQCFVQTPSPCLKIHVNAARFFWNFTYPDGQSDTNLLKVPKRTIIILNVTSVDVLHSVGLPDFGIKTDVIPGRNYTIWFVASQTGDFVIQCLEPCGTGHHVMKATLRVIEPSDFRAVA